MASVAATTMLEAMKGIRNLMSTIGPGCFLSFISGLDTSRLKDEIGLARLVVTGVASKLDKLIDE